MKILVLNSGSSSLKSSLYDFSAANAPPAQSLPAAGPADPAWQGEIEWSGANAQIKISTASGAKSKQQVKVASREEATQQLLATLWTGSTRVISSAKEINVVGHRVVNGGPEHREPALLDSKVIAAIQRAAAFAPLHNQAELDGIAIAQKLIPAAPQVAVFDTGFHRTLAPAAYVYPGPYDWLAKGIRRYGFHGINHAYIAERAPQILQRDIRDTPEESDKIDALIASLVLNDDYTLDQERHSATLTERGVSKCEKLLGADNLYDHAHHSILDRICRVLSAKTRSSRIVSCHLGNGCSLAAIRDGRSVDTTMGFTPLEGLMMGTRSGSIDPGILTYLATQEKQTGEQLDNLLNKKSGLLGIAGFSGDMREIIEEMNAGASAPPDAKSSGAKSPNSASTLSACALPIDAGDKSARAQLAFDMFIHRLRREIGSMIAVLGGLDALVFTAGIGENSADVRAAACDALAFAGVHLDATKNAQLGAHGAAASSNAGSGPADADIATAASPARVLVIKAQEDWAIARACFRLAPSS
jgi:acetate kinase